MKKASLILFFIASFGELLSYWIDSEILHIICKPLIMASLSAYYYFEAVPNVSRVVSLALIASMIGDIFLLSAKFFIPGLISFLIAHVLYIFAYRQHRTEDQASELNNVQRIRLAFPVLLAGTGLVVILFPVLGEMQIPVIIYASVITFMTLSALYRFGRTSSDSFWFVFFGAVLFMISDSILAVNKFLSPISNAGFWIMLTYISAQYLIVKGLLAHKQPDDIFLK